jgi:hypothetical protein
MNAIRKSASLSQSVRAGDAERWAASLASAVEEFEAMEILSCPRCIPEVQVPNVITGAVRAELCALVNQNKRAQGILLLRDKNVPLADAKFIVLHITQAGGACHRCGAMVEGEGAQHCKKCRSLNLKWCA